MRLLLPALLFLMLLSLASAVVITTCQDLSAVNTAYTFSQNITSTGGTCLNITAANISLDCGNFAIIGNSTSGVAAINSTAFNSSVKNCTISSFDIGINTRGSYGSFVWNNITSSVWVDNNDTTNTFNTSNNSGNIFYFSNGSGAWNVFNLIALVPPLWATYGASLPVSSATVGGNWSGVGVSWFPWTETGFSHPTVADIESNISQSTSSLGVFTTIASANITPASANKTYKAVVTANFCTWSNQQGAVEYQLLIDNISYGNWPYTVAANSCGDIAFLGVLFTSNGTNNFRVELQQRKTAGPTSWSANTTFSDTNVIGLRDLDSGLNISYANFTYNVTFSNSTMTLLKTFTTTLPKGQLVVLASRHANTSAGSNVTTEINITDAAGNIYPCNINLTRTLTAGVLGTGNVVECIVPANIPAGQVNISLYGQVIGGGQATIYGRVFEYISYGITTNESKSVALGNFSTSSTTMVQVKNITVDVERPNQDEEVIATMSVKGTSAGSVAPCQVRATNSSGLPVPVLTNVSEVENLTLPTANAWSILTLQHSIINLSNDNYTIALWCNVSAGTMSIGGGTLAASIADNTLTTLNPNSPVIYIPENTTYNKSINDTLLISYSNATSTGGQKIDHYKNDLFFSNGTFAMVIFANNSDNLTYLWNFSAVANGQYYMEITPIDVVGNAGKPGVSPDFTIQVTAIPIIAITYPTAGSAFGPNQCSFLTTANISFYANSTGRSAAVFFYLDGILQDSKNMTINGSGAYSANFTTLTQSGNYSVIWVASDSYGAAVNQTTWATLSGMASCVAAALSNPLEYPFVALVIMAITFIYFMGSWEMLHPFLAPFSNYLVILGLMSLSVGFLIIVQLTPSGGYDTAYMAAVYTFMAIGFYLGLRLIIMAWLALKAVLWK